MGSWFHVPVKVIGYSLETEGDRDRRARGGIDGVGDGLPAAPVIDLVCKS